MSVADYVKEISAIRSEYEGRLDRARRACDACREALEVEHGRALAAEEQRDALLEACKAANEVFRDLDLGHLVASDLLYKAIETAEDEIRQR